MRVGRVQAMPSLGIKMETAANSATPKEMLNIHTFRVICGYFDVTLDCLFCDVSEYLFQCSVNISFDFYCISLHKHTRAHIFFDRQLFICLSCIFVQHLMTLCSLPIFLFIFLFFLFPSPPLVNKKWAETELISVMMHDIKLLG